MTPTAQSDLSVETRSLVDQCIKKLADALGDLTRETVQHRCLDLSCLLAQALVSHGLENVTVVRSVDYSVSGRSHAWIEIGGYVVDVTAHQFNEHFDEPYIGPKTNWHCEEWPDQELTPAEDLTEKKVDSDGSMDMETWLKTQTPWSRCTHIS